MIKYYLFLVSTASITSSTSCGLSKWRWKLDEVEISEKQIRRTKYSWFRCKTHTAELTQWKHRVSHCMAKQNRCWRSIRRRNTQLAQSTKKREQAGYTFSLLCSRVTAHNRFRITKRSHTKSTSLENYKSSGKKGQPGGICRTVLSNSPIFYKCVVHIIIVISRRSRFALLGQNNKFRNIGSHSDLQENLRPYVDWSDRVLRVVFSESSTFEHLHLVGEVSKRLYRKERCNLVENSIQLDN